MTTSVKDIKKLAQENDVRVTIDKKGEDCEGKKLRRIGLHGFLDDIQAVAGQVAGYDVSTSATGWYLTKK